VTTLARLRANLDFMPSPVPERPGLLVRDPFGFAQGVLIIPPPLVPALACFDGQQTESDLRQALVRITGELEVGELLRHLADTLAQGGFLDDAVYAESRAAKEGEFAAASCRQAAHAGSAYPADAAALEQLLRAQLEPRDAGSADGLVGIAAPHVSPEGGARVYASAYQALPAALSARTFVVLGTSHYGAPHRFGLTRKPYVTPFGATQTDPELVERLAAARSSVVEDYCHAVEHSIEFQVVHLQGWFGAGVRVAPILCGPFDPAGGPPEEHPAVAEFLELLGAESRRRDDLFFVLGVDMAHVGRRYGDREPAQADEGPLRDVERRDRERIERLAAGDAAGFWDLVADTGKGDPLRWCGTAPFYTFLRAVQPARGALLRYEQWNIDPHSVVSFAGMTFSGGGP
jgi:AmmeMemoRadiSam system protein B